MSVVHVVIHNVRFCGEYYSGSRLTTTNNTMTLVFQSWYNYYHWTGFSASYIVSGSGKYRSISYLVSASGTYRSTSYLVSASGTYRSTSYLVSASGTYRSTSYLGSSTGKYRSTSYLVSASGKHWSALIASYIVPGP